MKNNKIKFIARDEYCWDVMARPFPASQALPDWWKSMSPYLPSEKSPEGKQIMVHGFESNATFKKCTPMLDALTSGYIFPLWSDVSIQKSPDNPLHPSLHWRVKGKQMFDFRGENARSVEVPQGYSEYVMKYYMGWLIKTPPGYSTLITAPFGYRNLPFLAIPVIVDTDKYDLELIPPMWVRNDFEGVVEKGTPMVQVTPFKRSQWEAEYDFLKNGEHERLEDSRFRTTFAMRYVTNIWSRKTYR